MCSYRLATWGYKVDGRWINQILSCNFRKHTFLMIHSSRQNFYSSGFVRLL
uniref:Uncharacterized protein n=1 Tax=Anguilla anguilla TaxID=7936 RepID=A0A0E9WX40_ANGAN